jgi:Raf kinase inhibitor-like YbhB/YbcL family protein
LLEVAAEAAPIGNNRAPSSRVVSRLNGKGRQSQEETMIADIKLESLSTAAGIALVLSWCACEPVNAQQSIFELTSSTFKDGTMMPRKVANKNPQNPNCVGDNVSPQLSWPNAPAGTKSFALTMVDPEGRGGLGVFHWVAYGIPSDVTSFAEGEVSKETTKYVGGKSTQGVGYYSGPCTPAGSPHHYTFLIIATDLEPKELAPGLTLPELQTKLTGKTKGAAGLVGLFVKPQ